MKYLIALSLLLYTFVIHAEPPVDATRMANIARTITTQSYPDVDIVVWDDTSAIRFPAFSAMLEYDKKRCAVIIDTSFESQSSLFPHEQLIDSKYRESFEYFIIYHELGHCDAMLKAEKITTLNEELNADTYALRILQTKHLIANSQLRKFKNQVATMRQHSASDYQTAITIQQAFTPAFIHQESTYGLTPTTSSP